jgi:hypothetical protein
MRRREVKKSGSYGGNSDRNTTMKEIKPTYPSRYKTDKSKDKTMKEIKPTYPSRYK